MLEMLTLDYVLRRRKELSGDSIAIVEPDSGRRVTFSEIDSRSGRIAGSLRQFGISKGDVIYGLFTNSVEFFDLLFACGKIGSILVPSNYRLSVPELLKQIEVVNPKLIFFDSMFAASARELVSRSQLPSVEMPSEKYDALLSGSEGEGSSLVAPSDGLLILFTSGSTGRPKGVVQTHSNIFLKSVDIVMDYGLTSSDVVLVSAPIFHVAGLNALTLPLLHLGGQIVLQRKFEPKQTWRLIEDCGVTAFAAAPTMLRLMLKEKQVKELRNDQLKFILVGGEPADQTLIKLFEAKSIKIYNVFGMTESTDGAIYVRPRDNVSAKDANCIGRPATHVEALAVDDNGSPVGTGQIGELVLRGGTITPGYFGHPEETEKVFRNGWFHTGDLVSIDHEGFFYIVGRTDDLIKSGAEKIYPSELEDVILQHPSVAEVAIIGVQDQVWGQTPKAVIVPKPGFKLNSDDIAEFCRERLAGFKRPKIIEVVDTLPHTGSGKLDRVTIRKVHGQGAINA